MLEFRSIYQIEQYYYPEFKKYIFKDDVRFHFSLNMPNIDIVSYANIFAKNIDSKSIRAVNIYADDIRSNKIVADKIKCSTMYSKGYVTAKETTAGNIRVFQINSDLIIVSDIIARYIKAKQIEYYTACIAIKHIDCQNIHSSRKNHICMCLDTAEWR